MPAVETTATQLTQKHNTQHTTVTQQKRQQHNSSTAETTATQQPHQAERVGDCEMCESLLHRTSLPCVSSEPLPGGHAHQRGVRGPQDGDGRAVLRGDACLPADGQLHRAHQLSGPPQGTQHPTPRTLSHTHTHTHTQGPPGCYHPADAFL